MMFSVFCLRCMECKSLVRPSDEARLSSDLPHKGRILCEQKGFSSLTIIQVWFFASFSSKQKDSQFVVSCLVFCNT